MFTGLVEELGSVQAVKAATPGLRLVVKTAVVGKDAAVGDSIAINGCCLTIVKNEKGLLMFDASERIVVCNRRYIEMYKLSPDVVKPGLAFRDLMSHRKERGTFSGSFDQTRRELRDH